MLDKYDFFSIDRFLIFRKIKKLFYIVNFIKIYLNLPEIDLIEPKEMSHKRLFETGEIKFLIVYFFLKIS